MRILLSDFNLYFGIKIVRSFTISEIDGLTHDGGLESRQNMASNKTVPDGDNHLGRVFFIGLGPTPFQYDIRLSN